MRNAVPESVIPDEFLGPEKLTEIFSKTKLNIHPCLYDAYGMTVIEAASQVRSNFILCFNLIP